MFSTFVTVYTTIFPMEIVLLNKTYIYKHFCFSGYRLLGGNEESPAASAWRSRLGGSLHDSQFCGKEAED